MTSSWVCVTMRAAPGYDAFLGERGVKLSGGQRQRIALARAFLKDAPILVLDEATSALDSEVEASIQTALNRVMHGKTVFAIAHRLSTIAAMDRIIVMDEGRVVEDGSHAALLAKSGLYARYWNRQSGGFIGTDDAQDAAQSELTESTDLAIWAMEWRRAPRDLFSRRVSCRARKSTARCPATG